MSRTITVKGVGHVTTKPDTIVIELSLDSMDMKYDKAMEIAADSISKLSDKLVGAGFAKDELKTTNFDVSTSYESVENKNGNYHREFNGYVVSHELKIEFPLDMKYLSDVLATVSDCSSHPEISISFVARDSQAIEEELLRSAAANAKRKAEILCETSGVKLGQLLFVNYSWGEINVYSDTDYDLAKGVGSIGAKPIDITPDDIDVKDTATFVWEID